MDDLEESIIRLSSNKTLPFILISIYILSGISCIYYIFHQIKI
jgi:hypothetical protein